MKSPNSLHSYREDLFQYIKKHGYKKGEFTLTSGKTSNFYMNIKGISLSKIGNDLLGYVLTDWLADKELVAVAGMELGAVPLVMACMSGNIHALIIRKTKKAGGLNNLIEGIENVEEGDSVVLIDDVATTGGSLVKSIEILHAASLRVSHVLCVVDRQEGAPELIDKEYGYQLDSLFTKEDFLKEEV